MNNLYIRILTDRQTDRQTDRISLPFSNALFQNYIEVFIRCMMPVSNRGYDAPFLRFWKGGIL